MSDQETPAVSSDNTSARAAAYSQTSKAVGAFAFFGPIIGWIAAIWAWVAVPFRAIKSGYNAAVASYHAAMDYTYGFRHAIQAWADRIGHGVTDLMARKWPEEAPVFNKGSRALGYAIMAAVLWVALAIAGHLIFPDKSKHVQGVLTRSVSKVAALSPWTKPAAEVAPDKQRDHAVPVEPAGKKAAEPPAVVVAAIPPPATQAVQESQVTMEIAPPVVPEPAAPAVKMPPVDIKAPMAAPATRKPAKNRRVKKTKHLTMTPWQQLINDITFGYLK